MASPIATLTAPAARSNWLHMGTLIFLRWTAIIGQLCAITIAHEYFDIELPLSLCFATVGASVVVNLISTYIFPYSKRLTERGGFLALLFDLTQLCVLLSLSGGLCNPFALLILAPVTIAAAALELRTTILIGAISILFVSLIAYFVQPVQFSDGSTLQVPDLLAFGFWLSIVIGICFLGLYSRRVSKEMRNMSDALLATQMALAREQKLTDLGGVIAAAAHELGTPLSTIKLVASELIDELEGQKDLQDDARLIGQQADRCRDILHSMGRAGKDDLHLRSTPFIELVREAAEPHIDRGKTLVFSFNPGLDAPEKQPLVQRRPEIIHGLRNLIQNAVDFAKTTVWVEGEWTDTRLTLRIIDDGDGFQPQMLNRIGDPFLRSRGDQEAARRPGYVGMGLGLFIAKTLLERTGAELIFSNGSNPFLSEDERPKQSGAIVELAWPAYRIVQINDQGLGENQPFQP